MVAPYGRKGKVEYVVPEVVIRAIKETIITMRHARVFVGSREKMHPTGQSLYDDNVKSLQQLLDDIKARD